MISKYINEEYLKVKAIKELNEKFNKNKPFPYLILNKFFKKEFLERVREEIKKLNFEHQESDLFSFDQSKDLELIENPILKEFYNFLNGKEFKDFLKEVTSIEAFGKIDASAFCYKDTDYLLPHDDLLEGRKIAYVINLTTLEEKEGGALEFFNQEHKVKSITPLFNNFIIFKVVENKTIHQVSEIMTEKERVTIAGWFNA